VEQLGDGMSDIKKFKSEDENNMKILNRARDEAS
jgi:hypothetical protein